MRAENPIAHRAPPTATNLEQRYLSVRRSTMSLIAPLAAEDCQVQTMPEVSPTKWHLAHTTWFFERFCLRPHCRDYIEFAPEFDFLFNSYYYTVGEMHRRAERGLLSRPLLHEVIEYRAHVDAAMSGFIARASADPDMAFLVTLGLHHEQQHQELLLTDIKHVFFTNPLHPVYASPIERSKDQALPHRFIERPCGRFSVGHAGADFSFDNETPRHDVLIEPHALGNRLITNAEFGEFIKDGGYSEARLWLADGWSGLQVSGWSHPLYWSDDGCAEFTLGGWQPLDAAAPVAHISYYEADAFARWAGARLPSEAEWELAACDQPIAGNTLDTGTLAPVAASGDAAATPQQLYGDVWEWTASPYVPYPGFQPLAGSLGEYNGKFMSSQIVVRGGSCATWAAHLRPTYRSFFYPQDRWQFLGLRLARDCRS